MNAGAAWFGLGLICYAALWWSHDRGPERGGAGIVPPPPLALRRLIRARDGPVLLFPLAMQLWALAMAIVGLLRWLAVVPETAGSEVQNALILAGGSAVLGIGLAVLIIGRARQR